MQKIKFYDDVAYYATKYSVQGAAEAYRISKSAVYRSILKQAASAGNSHSVPLPSVIELDFTVCTLREPGLKSGKATPGLYLLTARDVVSKNSYYALGMEQNKSTIAFFLDYLRYHLKKNNADCLVDYSKHHYKSCYNLSVSNPAKRSGSYFSMKEHSAELPNKRQQVMDLTTDLKAELISSLPARSQDQLVEQLTIIYAHQLLKDKGAILPIVIWAREISAVAQYVSPAAFWQEYQSPCSTTFYQACNLLYQQADRLFFGGETDRAIAVCEKLLKLSRAEESSDELKKLQSRICLLTAKANGYKFYHAQAIEHFNQAMELDPDNCDIYFQIYLYNLTINNHTEAKMNLLTAKKKCANYQTAEEKFRYYQLTGEYYFRYEANYHYAAKNFRKIKAEAEAIGDPALIYEANGHLGNLNYQNRNYALAEKIYLENLELVKSMQDRVKHSTVLYNLGLIYQAQDNFAQAESCIWSSLNMSRRHKDHYKTVICLTNYAMLLHKQQKYTKSLKVYAELLNHYVKPDSKHPQLVDIYNGMGAIYKQQGHFKKAVGYLNRALAAEAGLTDQPFTPYILNQLANILIKQGKPEQAESKLQKALKVTKDVASMNIIRATACLNLAKIFLEQKAEGKAKKLLIESANLFKGLHLRTGDEYYKQKCAEVASYLKECSHEQSLEKVNS